MRALIRAARRRDPAPSKFLFRIKRLWRSRTFRRVALVWAPLAVVTGGLGWAVSQTDIAQEAQARFTTAMNDMADRPEFAIRRVAVIGADGPVAEEITRRLTPMIGASSLKVQANTLRDDIADIGWVKAARVRLIAPKTLEATVSLREPAVLWRMDGQLSLLDRTGALIALVESRLDFPDLPLVAGLGADRPPVLAEALDIFASASRAASRIRGLVRIGERRWDVVVDDGPRILLPAKGAVDAMGYLAALEAGESVLGKDLKRIDLRLRGRPTLRLGPDAQQELEATRKAASSEGEDA
ncbi:MAG: cell division protein FtsQ/DivIB [Pikeienuella sp.]